MANGGRLSRFEIEQLKESYKEMVLELLQKFQEGKDILDALHPAANMSSSGDCGFDVGSVNANISSSKEPSHNHHHEVCDDASTPPPVRNEQEHSQATQSSCDSDVNSSACIDSTKGQARMATDKQGTSTETTEVYHEPEGQSQGGMQIGQKLCDNVSLATSMLQSNGNEETHDSFADNQKQSCKRALGSCDLLGPQSESWSEVMLSLTDYGEVVPSQETWVNKHAELKGENPNFPGYVWTESQFYLADPSPRSPIDPTNLSEIIRDPGIDNFPRLQFGVDFEFERVKHTLPRSVRATEINHGAKMPQNVSEIQDRTRIKFMQSALQVALRGIFGIPKQEKAGNDTFDQFSADKYKWSELCNRIKKAECNPGVNIIFLGEDHTSKDDQARAHSFVENVFARDTDAKQILFFEKELSRRHQGSIVQHTDICQVGVLKEEQFYYQKMKSRLENEYAPEQRSRSRMMAANLCLASGAMVASGVSDRVTLFIIVGENHIKEMTEDFKYFKKYSGLTGTDFHFISVLSNVQ
eukprot:Colp12_sorted_trinity150504_noHs@32308